MYCVKCGVKLKDGVSVCPLCHTKMHFEDNSQVSASYSDLLPTTINPNVDILAILSVIFAIVCIVIMAICFNLYGHLSWGAYVLASIFLFYIVIILPLWFPKSSPVIFVCINFASIALFLLFVNNKTHGHWFLSFALPLVLLVGTLFIVGYSLRRFIKKAGFFIFGGLFIGAGLFCILIEMFECITFNTKMFTWSLYAVSITALIGIFLILCGLIKPLKDTLTKRFFV